MKKLIIGILSLFIGFFMFFSANTFAATKDTTAFTDTGVHYMSHIENRGWEQDWKSNGDISGTIGESLRIESVKVGLIGEFQNIASIQTSVHVQDKGDMGPFAMGEAAGTTGLGLRIESIKLVLENMPGYVIKYDVQVENKGWLKDVNDTATWFVGGEDAGTKGESLRLEAIKIIIVQTTDLLPFFEAIEAVNEMDYTTESWATYYEVVKANLVTMANTQEEVNIAAVNIVAAQSSLVAIEGDLTPYIEAISAVNEMDYTTESWATYSEVVKAHIVTKANTQTQITIAAARITTAQSSLVIKEGDLTPYIEAISAVNEMDYTPESWAIYFEVVEANIVTKANTQTQITIAAARISSAQKYLILK
ncbi:hypothetical protein [Acetobacterium sp.]|uniref:hypothetical protein n=1 Tax=Acetobacterium sp. TaxID=1872094 RepID=UPI00271C8580|nr:hypothetical protein [Acetobacterium sp.]MDO9493178.1 hypothetical protein [Acetobacterium sp.]